MVSRLCAYQKLFSQSLAWRFSFFKLVIFSKMIAQQQIEAKTNKMITLLTTQAARKNNVIMEKSGAPTEPLRVTASITLPSIFSVPVL